MDENQDCDNPVAKKFPTGFSNWQFLVLREAFRQHMKSAERSGTSFSVMAETISDHSSENIGSEALSRFKAGYYGKDANGYWKQPKLPLLHAVAWYLMDEDVDALSMDDLRTRSDGYQIPTRLARFVQHERVNYDTYLEDESDQHTKETANYFGTFKLKSHTLLIALHIEIPKGGEYLSVRKGIYRSEKIYDLSCSNLNQDEKKIDYDGWGIFMPEGYTLFLLKDTMFNYNSVAITSSEFNYSKDNVMPEKFHAFYNEDCILNLSANKSSEKTIMFTKQSF